MDYLPVFLDVRGRQVLVDGGDTLAARRVERALSAGAMVLAFDPDPGQELLALSDQPALEIHTRLPLQSDVEGCIIVYGASEDRDRDALLHGWAKTEKVLCNIADWPDKCDFITPSIVDRAPIVIAISTGGAAPVIARILRARIETILPSAFGRLASFASGFRDQIAAVIGDGRDRRRFWESMIDGAAGDYFLAGNANRARDQITDDLQRHATGTKDQQGEVYLVGAGPGDPDLLSFRALRLMQRCDVVLHDRQIGDDILSLVRRDAKRICVAGSPLNHNHDEKDIPALIVALAKQGNRVLRLTTGDPFTFGNGGEEIETLAEKGIGFQVVPGITRAAGSASYAGIPLTHIDHAQSCTFVTAKDKTTAAGLNWKSLIRPNQTVAVYADPSALPAIFEALRDANVDMTTPVAAIENGTRDTQIVVTGHLSKIEKRAAHLTGPTMIIIGSVVTLRDKLNWAGTDMGGKAMTLSSATTAAAMTPGIDTK